MIPITEELTTRTRQRRAFPLTFREPLAEDIAADQATLWASWSQPQRVVLDINELQQNFFFRQGTNR